MTTLEIVFTIVMWIITGVFISYKREWYYRYIESEMAIVFAIFFSPVMLIVTLFRVYKPF